MKKILFVGLIGCLSWTGSVSFAADSSPVAAPTPIPEPLLGKNAPSVDKKKDRRNVEAESEIFLELKPSASSGDGEKEKGESSRDREGSSSRPRKLSGWAGRLSAVANRSPRNDVLIVHAGKPTAARHDEMEQDMRIMAHLLGKRLEQSGEPEEAMGIPISFSGKNFRHFYLEGYGAVFTFQVPFALAPPVVPGEENEKDPALRSDWDQIRRQLYGSRRTQEREDTGRQYDRGAIEKLQLNLLQALTNAYHIRNLKADDRIVVVLSQSSQPSDLVTWKLEDAVRLAENDARVVARRRWNDDATGAGTTLQITVRRNEIEALAKGINTFEDFRHTALIVAY